MFRRSHFGRSTVNSRSFALFLLLVSVWSHAPEAQAQYQVRYWDFDAADVNGYEPGEQRDDVVPGEFLIDPPTLENLGFRWYIEGDSNRNASVAVEYRREDAETWQTALPMLRVHHEIVMRYSYDGHNKHYRTGNLFAGSIFSLEPGTAYEVRLTMTDPDGGASEEVKQITVATRPEPQAASDGRTLHVYPTDAEGDRDQSPAFDGLMAAYDAAQPGDVILLHAGVHRVDDAPYVLTKSGEPDKPIVFRGEGAGRTVIEGPNTETDLFRIPGVDHLMFEDLTARRAAMFIQTGETSRHDKDGPGASWLTVRRCTIEDVVNGLWSASPESQNWYIADNVITGLDE